MSSVSIISVKGVQFLFAVEANDKAYFVYKVHFYILSTAEGQKLIF